MRYLVITLLIFISVGCSNESITEEITFIEPGRAYEVSFKEKPGHATIILDKSRGIDFIVWIKELDPDKGYEIALVRNDGKGGVVFGPEENLDIKIGKIEGETILHPNHNGELNVSMLNPERIFVGADQVIIKISTMDQKVITQSFPFKF
jgi:hypothetical protein